MHHCSETNEPGPHGTTNAHEPVFHQRAQALVARLPANAGWLDLIHLASVEALADGIAPDLTNRE
jgi:hypothetical protein